MNAFDNYSDDRAPYANVQWYRRQIRRLTLPIKQLQALALRYAKDGDLVESGEQQIKDLTLQIVSKPEMDEDSDDPTWEPFNARKRIKYKYDARQKSSKSSSAAKTLQTPQRAQSQPGEIRVPTPLLRSSSGDLNADEGPVLQGLSKKQRLHELLSHIIVPLKLSSDDKETKRKLVDTLIQNLKRFLESSQGASVVVNDGRRPDLPGSSLFFSSIRDLPKFIELLQDEADQNDDNDHDMADFTFMMLEEHLGPVQSVGWKHMKPAVRAYGINLVLGFIREALENRLLIIEEAEAFRVAVSKLLTDREKNQLHDILAPHCMKMLFIRQSNIEKNAHPPDPRFKAYWTGSEWQISRVTQDIRSGLLPILYLSLEGNEALLTTAIGFLSRNDSNYWGAVELIETFIVRYMDLVIPFADSANALQWSKASTGNDRDNNAALLTTLTSTLENILAKALASMHSPDVAKDYGSDVMRPIHSALLVTLGQHPEAFLPCDDQQRDILFTMPASLLIFVDLLAQYAGVVWDGKTTAANPEKLEKYFSTLMSGTCTNVFKLKNDEIAICGHCEKVFELDTEDLGICRPHGQAFPIDASHVREMTRQLFKKTSLTCKRIDDKDGSNLLNDAYKKFSRPAMPWMRNEGDAAARRKAAEASMRAIEKKLSEATPIHGKVKYIEEADKAYKYEGGLEEWVETTPLHAKKNLETRFKGGGLNLEGPIVMNRPPSTPSKSLSPSPTFSERSVPSSSARTTRSPSMIRSDDDLDELSMFDSSFTSVSTNLTGHMSQKSNPLVRKRKATTALNDTDDDDDVDELG